MATMPQNKHIPPSKPLLAAKPVPLVIILLAGFMLFMLPAPTGLSDAAWHTAIVFVGTIAGIVSNVLPVGAVGFLGITIFALTAAGGEATAKDAIADALQDLDNHLIWLIVIAFMVARGFIKTGLGKRVALIMVRFMGKKTLGLAYGLSLADLLLSPAMPSNTARCGGVIYPIANSLALSFSSKPNDPSSKKIGTFLISCIGHVNDITAALFVTAYAANPLIMKLAADAGVHLSWGSWFLAALVPALVALLVIPIVLYFLTKPEIRETPDAPNFAAQELKKMGAISRDEWVMLCVFGVLLVLWIFGSSFGIHSTTAAFIGLSLLLLFGVLSWDDVKKEQGAWDTLIWFAALLMMANMLKALGFTQWFGEEVGQLVGGGLSGAHWIIILVALNAVYMYTHYFFASGTAQVAALFAVFLNVGIHLAVPPFAMAMTLAMTSSLYCSLTQYSHARGPILFGSGYVPTQVWWRTGFLTSLVNQAIFIGVGLAWWTVLGLI